MTTLTFTRPDEFGYSICRETGDVFDEYELDHARGIAVDEVETPAGYRLTLTDENARLLVAPAWMTLDAALARLAKLAVAV